jgi:hypothetical protein
MSSEEGNRLFPAPAEKIMLGLSAFWNLQWYIIKLYKRKAE